MHSIASNLITHAGSSLAPRLGNLLQNKLHSDKGFPPTSWSRDQTNEDPSAGSDTKTQTTTERLTHAQATSTGTESTTPGHDDFVTSKKSYSNNTPVLPQAAKRKKDTTKEQQKSVNELPSHPKTEKDVVQAMKVSSKPETSIKMTSPKTRIKMTSPKPKMTSREDLSNQNVNRTADEGKKKPVITIKIREKADTSAERKTAKHIKLSDSTTTTKARKKTLESHKDRGKTGNAKPGTNGKQKTTKTQQSSPDRSQKIKVTKGKNDVSKSKGNLNKPEHATNVLLNGEKKPSKDKNMGQQKGFKIETKERHTGNKGIPHKNDSKNKTSEKHRGDKITVNKNESKNKTTEKHTGDKITVHTNETGDKTSEKHTGDKLKVHKNELNNAIKANVVVGKTTKEHKDVTHATKPSKSVTPETTPKKVTAHKHVHHHHHNTHRKKTKTAKGPTNIDQGPASGEDVGDGDTGDLMTSPTPLESLLTSSTDENPYEMEQIVQGPKDLVDEESNGRRVTELTGRVTQLENEVTVLQAAIANLLSRLGRVEHNTEGMQNVTQHNTVVIGSPKSPHAHQNIHVLLHQPVHTTLHPAMVTGESAPQTLPPIDQESYPSSEPGPEPMPTSEPGTEPMPTSEPGTEPMQPGETAPESYPPSEAGPESYPPSEAGPESYPPSESGPNSMQPGSESTPSSEPGPDSIHVPGSMSSRPGPESTPSNEPGPDSMPVPGPMSSGPVPESMPSSEPGPDSMPEPGSESSIDPLSESMPNEAGTEEVPSDPRSKTSNNVTVSPSPSSQIYLSQSEEALHRKPNTEAQPSKSKSQLLPIDVFPSDGMFPNLDDMSQSYLLPFDPFFQRMAAPKKARAKSTGHQTPSYHRLPTALTTEAPGSDIVDDEPAEPADSTDAADTDDMTSQSVDNPDITSQPEPSVTLEDSTQAAQAVNIHVPKAHAISQKNAGDVTRPTKPMDGEEVESRGNDIISSAPALRLPAPSKGTGSDQIVRPIVNIIVRNPETASAISNALCNPKCQNGGECIGSNTCKCPTLFVGKTCEHFSLLDFLGSQNNWERAGARRSGIPSAGSRQRGIRPAQTPLRRTKVLGSSKQDLDLRRRLTLRDLIRLGAATAARLNARKRASLGGGNVENALAHARLRPREVVARNRAQHPRKQYILEI